MDLKYLVDCCSRWRSNVHLSYNILTKPDNVDDAFIEVDGDKS